LAFADAAVGQAVEALFLRIAQVESGKQLPGADRHIAHQRLADLPEPAHEASQRDARDAVVEKEVQVFLLQHVVSKLSKIHASVKSSGQEGGHG
jgi:phage terminase Nu1 subunit (DNA packaging protein)